MMSLCNELLSNEDGFILSAEMVMILTIAVLGIVVGLAQVQQAVVTELQDLSLAFSGLNQSYMTPAFRGCFKWGRPISWSAGSGFIDFYDSCVGTGGVAPMGWGNGNCEIGGGNVYSGAVSTPVPIIEAPHSTVTAPCVNCPQPAPSLPAPTPSPLTTQ